jgi:hypothetical protein
MNEQEPSHEQLIEPKVGDLVRTNLRSPNLPFLVISVDAHTVEAGAIYVREDGTEELTYPGTIFMDWIVEVVEHWDIERMLEAVKNSFISGAEQKTIDSRIENMRQQLTEGMKADDTKPAD